VVAEVYTQTPTGTHVATHESFSGQPVEADPTGMQAGLDKSLPDWPGHLKSHRRIHIPLQAGRVPGRAR
jgi:hypothetical protein